MKFKTVLSSLLVVGSCLGIGTTGFAATCNSTLGPITTAGVYAGVIAATT